jgi:hypothetical protein
MKLGDPSVVNLPVVRLVFEDLAEFADLQVLANQLGMGRDWPMAMLRDYLASYKMSHQVGNKPFCWGSADSAA